MKKFRVTSVQSVLLRVGVKLGEFGEDEETESWPFRPYRALHVEEELIWRSLTKTRKLRVGRFVTLLAV